MDHGSAARLAAGLAIGLGGIGPGIGIGIAVMGAMQAIGRNPDAEGAVRGTLILGAGLAEAVAIYAFVTALVLIFVAVYAGRTLAQANAFLKTVQATKKFAGIRVRRMQVGINGT